MDCVGIRNVSPSQLALVGAGALVAVLTYTCSVSADTLKVINLASTFFLAVCYYEKMQKNDASASVFSQRVPPTPVLDQNIADKMHLSITFNLGGERAEVEVLPTATVLELKSAIVKARQDVYFPVSINLFIDGDEEELHNRCRLDELGIDTSSQLRALCTATKTQDEVLEIIHAKLDPTESLSRRDFIRGVVTDRDGNVIKINLWSFFRSLHGFMQPEIGLLTSLKQLDLSHNRLTGVIPSELGDLVALQELNLNGNQLTGLIPSTLGTLSALQELHLYSNDLTGVIPSALGTLFALQRLDLECNQLTGQIPVRLRQVMSGPKYTGDTEFTQQDGHVVK